MKEGCIIQLCNVAARDIFFNNIFGDIYLSVRQFLYFVLFISGLVNSQTVMQAVQCYSCGLPNIHPDNDIKGSYPNIKTYNHTCDEMSNTMVKGKISNKFVRTCPLGVVSCFGATGLYDHGDNDPSNDICKLRFLKYL
jgi:hypothetical protein